MIKKWFFDYWDNLFHFSIINIVFIISFLIPIGIPAMLASYSVILSVVVMIIGLLWMGILSSATSLYINEIIQFRTPEIRQFFGFLRKGLPLGILYAGLWTVVVIVFYFAMSFYASFQHLLGLVAVAFLFWSLLGFILAAQYYFPIIAQLDRRPRKIFQKMFIILFDNPFFSVLLFLFSVIIFLLSGLTAFILFGPSGIMLIGQVGFKLRLYKYDYLEEHPESSRRNIPWDTLIYEDRERVGHRSIKNFFFPWKD